MHIKACAIVFLLLLLNSCLKKDEHAEHDQYTCPMHPTVVRDSPGTCPVCGMDLVRKGQPGGEVKITAELNYLLKPANAMVISPIKTILPTQKAMELTSTASGIITYDTRRITSIPIRFGGRIDKLLIKFNFQPIHKGQKILEIYSPELLNAQRDLLYLVKSDTGNAPLINGAKEKLRLLGVSETQIDQLLSTGQESYSFDVFSPVDGYIVENASPGTSVSKSQAVASPMDGGMNAVSVSAGENSIQTAQTELLTREGMYVTPGQVIFKVINTDYLWAEINTYQRDAAQLKVNDAIRLTFEDRSEGVEGKVDFIQPFLKDGENFIKVRVYLSNTGSKYQVGQLVKASLGKLSPTTMWIPASARLDLGTKEIVFIKRRGVFRPKEIVVGRQSDEWIEVAQGLEAGDSVAFNAQFMIDSEGFIKVRN